MDLEFIDTNSLLITLWVIGISAESVTAALSAGRLKFDWFGVVTLACLTALGGGTIRNILLNVYPLTWVEQPAYLVLCIVVALVTTQLSVLARYFYKIFMIGDAIGLATFAVLGTQMALDEGHGFVIAAVSAVVTGVSGGVMRDLMSNRIPLVFTQDLYASIAILTTAVYMFCTWIDLPENWVIIISLLVGFFTRVLNMRDRRGLPIFSYDENQPLDPRLELSTRFLKESMSKVRRKALPRFETRRYSFLNRLRRKNGEDKDPEQKWPPEEGSEDTAGQ